MYGPVFGAGSRSRVGSAGITINAVKLLMRNAGQKGRKQQTIKVYAPYLAVINMQNVGTVAMHTVRRLTGYERSVKGRHTYTFINPYRKL